MTTPAPRRPTQPLHTDQPLVTHRFLAGGVAVIVLGAIAAIYFALGLLFWQGQWQLIFHPSREVTRTPRSLGLAYTDVRFDAGETGHPRLNGWWVPGGPAQGSRRVVLFLHAARGSISDALPEILALHATGADLFAFDPRGFGSSDWAKPSEQHWNQDAGAALRWLEGIRHVAPQDVVVIGEGLGATVAANLVPAHPRLERLAMIDPQPPTLGLLEAPRWTHVLPVRLLERDRFDPSEALRSTAVRKLILLTPGATSPAYLQNPVPPTNEVRGPLDSPSAQAALAALLGPSPPPAAH